MLDTTGLPTQFTSTEKPEVLLLPVRNPEVSTRVTYSTTPRLAVVTPGRETTPYPYGDTDLKCDYRSIFAQVFAYATLKWIFHI